MPFYGVVPQSAVDPTEPFPFEPAGGVDMAVDMTLNAIDKIIFLRVKMEEAVMKLRVGYPRDALDILQKALAETDVGKMKEWQPGEEPF